METNTKRHDLVTVDGCEWRVVAVGVTSGDAVYVHLAALTRGTHQKNGFRPAQACGWLRGTTLSNRP